MHRRPRKLVIGAALTALVAVMAQASAHVTLGIPTLEVTDVNYRVPVEPAPTTPEELEARHNEKLVVDVPVGFIVERCHETADFACEVANGQITWTRRADSTNYRPVDWFRASMRTPGIGGTYLSPALQVYSDGEEVPWDDAATSDPNPAPQIRVNGPDRAPAVATGTFRPLAELGAGTPCPQEVIDDAIRLGIDPAVHCGHFGFEPPAGSPPPPPGEPGPDVRGTASIARTPTTTFVEVVVTGLEPGVTYDAHLHEGTCTNPTSAHYKNDPTGPDAPPNELWPSDDPTDPLAGLTADENGVARGFGVADWVARPTARAIWIHEPPDDPNDPHAHARIGCADLV